MPSNDSVVYAFRWNSKRKRPGRVISEKEAFSRWCSGEEFTVVVPSGAEKNFGTLVTFDLKNRHVITSFLDDQGRKYMEYTYRREGGSWLFLYLRNYWTYPNRDPDLDIDTAAKAEEALQAEDGYTRRVIIDEVENMKETREYRNVPVDGNWVQFPEFGEWGELARYDR